MKDQDTLAITESNTASWTPYLIIIFVILTWFAAGVYLVV